MSVVRSHWKGKIQGFRGDEIFGEKTGVPVEDNE